MRKGGLSRDLALRIGLAARCLPEPDLPLLMSVLLDSLGMPLTEPKLNSLSFQQLRTGAAGTLAGQPRAVLRRVLGYLRGTLQASIIKGGDRLRGRRHARIGARRRRRRC